MKKILLTVAIIVAALMSYAQKTNYPAGIYMILTEVDSKTPSKSATVSVVNRSRDNEKGAMGNDYRLTSEDKGINKILKKRAFGYSDGTDFFINCFPIGLMTDYSKVICDGRYMIFKACFSKDSKEFQQVQSTGVMFGAIGSLSTMGAWRKRYLYAFDKQSNKVITINATSIRPLLEKNQELSQLFINEENKTDETVLIKYMTLLNQQK